MMSSGEQRAKRTGFGRQALIHTPLINAARTAVATVASMLLARSLRLPEFYWAPISTVVILLSTINPMTLAWQRFAGTALGAALGALIATFFTAHWMVYERFRCLVSNTRSKETVGLSAPSAAGSGR